MILFWTGTACIYLKNVIKKDGNTSFFGFAFHPEFEGTIKKKR